MTACARTPDGLAWVVSAIPLTQDESNLALLYEGVDATEHDFAGQRELWLGN